MAAKEPNDQETIRLTPEQMEAIALADLAFKRGEGLTPSEVRELARNQTNAGITAKHSKTA